MIFSKGEAYDYLAPALKNDRLSLDNLVPFRGSSSDVWKVLARGKERAIGYIATTRAVRGSGASAPINTTGAGILIVVTLFDVVPVGNDSYGNAWISLPSVGGSYAHTVHYCINPVCGPGHTFSFISGSNAVAYMSAFSGAFIAADACTAADVVASTATPAPIAVSGRTLCFSMLLSEQLATGIEGDYGIVASFPTGVAFGGQVAFREAFVSATKPKWIGIPSGVGLSVSATFSARVSSNTITRLGLFGDVHLNPSAASRFLNEFPHGPNNIGLYASWLSFLNKELAFLNKTDFGTVPVSENVLFNDLVMADRSVNTAGSSTINYDEYGGENIPVFEFNGYMFNLNQG